MNELLPCPFCGGTMRIQSNRAWHKLYGAHDDDCILDPEEALMTVPATDQELEWLINTWNRRVFKDLNSIEHKGG